MVFFSGVIPVVEVERANDTTQAFEAVFVDFAGQPVDAKMIALLDGEDVGAPVANELHFISGHFGVLELGNVVGTARAITNLGSGDFASRLFVQTAGTIIKKDVAGSTVDLACQHFFGKRLAENETGVVKFTVHCSLREDRFKKGFASCLSPGKVVQISGIFEGIISTCMIVIRAQDVVLLDMSKAGSTPVTKRPNVGRFWEGKTKKRVTEGGGVKDQSNPQEGDEHQ